MNDRDFLIWLHERLVNIHGENDCYGFMHRLRNIIANTPAAQKSPAVVSNSLTDLKKHINEKEKAVA